MKNYFKDSELQCTCGCNKNNFQTETKMMLNVARERAGIPFIVNSACRCDFHNKLVGGSPTSSHLKGVAVDIRVINSNHRLIIASALLYAGFKRIGIANGFIHADNDTRKTQEVLWTY